MVAILPRVQALALTREMEISPTTQRFDGASGSLGLIVLGTGTLVLSGQNTYRGGTDLEGDPCNWGIQPPSGIPAVA